MSRPTTLPSDPAALSDEVCRAHGVLIVDDEAANRTVLEVGLRKHFQVWSADSGAAALRILSEQKISVLLSDYLMPEMNGVDLCEAVRESHPRVVRMILTAYEGSSIMRDAINRGRISRYLLKPWKTEEVVFALREAIWRLESHAELERLRREAEAIDRTAALSLGASGALHDLSSHLQPVVLDATALGDLLAAPADALDIERIRLVQGRVVLGLQHLAAIHHSWAPHQRPALQRQRLRPILDAALRVVAKTEGSDLAVVEVECDDRIEVLTHSASARRILVNLLSNAVQAVAEADRGVGLVRVHVEPTDDRVAVRIEDDGPGIPADLVEHIFLPGETGRLDQGGTGLGLAIGQRLAQACEATLALEGTSERGTTFALSLPVGDS